MRTLAPLALVVLLLAACDDGPAAGEPDTAVDTDSAPETDAEGPTPIELAHERFCGPDWADVESRVDELLSELTLDEKVGLMHGASLAPRNGVWEVSGLPQHDIPGLHMTDGPRGVGATSGALTTAFPVGVARGASWSPALEERVGEVMGVEARAIGADVILAPTINVVRHPRWGRAQESYGEDPFHVGVMGVAFIRGAQRHVVASAKHYAANSIEETRFEVDVRLDERTLREIYLPHFRRAVVDGPVGSVMSAYNRVNGEYCSENRGLLSDILVDDWGFLGFVESDWAFGTNSTVEAALAGLHIEMPFERFFGARLLEAVEARDVPAAVIDEAVRRILRVQLCFELDADPPVRDPGQLATAEHRELAREAARRGIVLLKNEAALPLDPHLIGSIAVLGRLADVENIGDNGSSDVVPPDVVTALQGLTEAFGSDAVVHVTELNEAGRATVSTATAAIVVTGLSADDEGEGLVAAGDRETLALSEVEVALIEAVAALSEQTIVVLEGGGALTMPWLDDVEAVFMAWYPGMEGGRAIADVITAVSPSGRLPVVFPNDEADLPAFDNTGLEVEYGYYHGYRHLDRENVEPLFPFGFGLSYTTFELSDLRLDDDNLAASGTLVARVDVTNTGDFPAVHTVQAYVGVPDSSVDRPERDLRAFAQIELEPGQRGTAVLEVPAADLAYWDADAGRFEVERTEYVVEVGHSSRDLPLSAGFQVE